MQTDLKIRLDEQRYGFRKTLTEQAERLDEHIGAERELRAELATANDAAHSWEETTKTERAIVQRLETRVRELEEAIENYRSGVYRQE